MIKSWTTIFILFLPLLAFTQQISGKVTDENENPLKAEIFIDGVPMMTTGMDGLFQWELISGKYEIAVFVPGFETAKKEFEVVEGEMVTMKFKMKELLKHLNEVTIASKKEAVESWLNSVEGMAIYESKKTEVIQLDQVIANKGANVSRQVYARVPGLNIWENDGAGVQLAIGGRGLSPNRTANFNVRQNGYDIAADALGYPESYYTPPVLALEKIEIVRGAAGLQYGTQFGGLLNFKFKDGPLDKKVDINLINTVGSFGLVNSFNSVGGTVGKVNYYGFYQYKHSTGWRPNAELGQHNAFGSVTYNFNTFLSLKLEHTYMSYLAHQPGGMTDAEFEQNPQQSKRERNWFHVGWNLSAMEWSYRVSSNLKFNNRTFHLSANRYAVGNLGPINRIDDPNENRNLLKDDYNNWGNEFRAIVHYPFLGQKSVFLIGNRVYFGQTDRAQGEGTKFNDPNFSFINPKEPDDSQFQFPGQNVAFFMENIFNISPKISVTPGVRYEYIVTDADGYYFDKRKDQAGNIVSSEKIDEKKSKSRSFALFGIGISYKSNDHLEAYSNFSQNFRAINFNDIRVDNPSLVVDENIGDERGYNLDLGIRGSVSSKFKYDVSLFYLSYENRIGNILKEGADPRFTFYVPKIYRFRTNLGDAAIAGLEIYLEYVPFPFIQEKKRIDFTTFINLAALYSRYPKSNESGIVGNKVELVPPVNIKVGFNFKYQNFGMSWLTSYVHQQYSDASNADKSPAAVEGIIPTYSVMDISFEYHWSRWTLESGVNNLTNNAYFTRRAAGYPGPGILPSDPRTIYFTLGVNF